jgi:hypothetical protein
MLGSTITTGLGGVSPSMTASNFGWIAPTMGGALMLNTPPKTVSLGGAPSDPSGCMRWYAIGRVGGLGVK